MLKFLALLTLLASTAVHAEIPLHTDLPLKYLEQANVESRNQPLVIFLHGYGSNEQDLFGIKDELPPQYTYLSVRAPMTLEEGSYQWFRKKGEGAYNGETDDLKTSRQVLLDFVAQAAKKYHTETDKVFLVGFSQGAIMSYEVALRHPEAVGGIAALSGRILPVLKSELKPDEKRQSLAIFIGHGTADKRLPYTDGTEADSLLQSLSLKPEFHAYEGVGHSISATEMQDLSAWLQRLNP
ncbi:MULTISPECIES: alpha/beta hydrolase [Pseudomonas]|jgi:phospholipase/carboxylesterase|uniref:alpha/beta hydrolase n=1 Tax=Pseudomonas TaxID=286 RepID=UPI000B35DC9C|nr:MULTISPECIES: dienelactone hydrolase family protein [Pseudomonas]MBD9607021.1 dienelactone hydrolase family protein [Pseudomonas sp. PDM08]MDR7107193.1 phospholipase/carboxylesterase [Pseudomonas frederiksbergensis]PMY56239.1 phospholipase [Pseudomonas sp. FW305-53]PMY89107.1 phospholipase [Pseudomonas sp. FW303-C2]PMY93245.1 phospholipase [Pseudomonas sp. FW305-62]